MIKSKIFKSNSKKPEKELLNVLEVKWLWIKKRYLQN